MLDKRGQTACFTGHRFLPANQIAQIRGRIISEMELLIDRGIIYYGCGGALGFDTIAATAVLELRERHPHIKLIMVLPCRDQDKLWKQAEQQRYRDILSKADSIKYLAEEYTDGCMLERNRHLVQYSCTCIAYQTKKNGGAAFTVNLARRQGLTVINIADQIA